jgi:hypothetical protein
VSDLAELYLVLVLIYAFECAAFVPRRALALVRRSGRWRVRPTFAPSAGWLRGFVFGEPWPPLSPALVTEPLPLVVGPDGLYALGDQHFVQEHVPWRKVERVAVEGTRLLINGKVVAQLATRVGARGLAEAFDGLAAQPRPERESRLRRWLDARFDGAAIQARLAPMWRGTLAVRIAATVLWVTVFAGLPVLLWTPLAALFLVVGVVAVAAWITAAVLFELALRRSRWLPGGLRPDLAKRIAALASPLATMRACDHLARELAGDLDPLAAAAPLVRVSDLGALGRARLVDLRHRRGDDPPEGGEADRGWWQRETLVRVEQTLRERGIDPDALLAQPAPDGADMIAWCPCCLAQYRGGDEAPRACANAGCGGIVLCRFGQPAGVMPAETPARNSPA